MPSGSCQNLDCHALEQVPKSTLSCPRQVLSAANFREFTEL